MRRVTRSVGTDISVWRCTTPPPAPASSPATAVKALNTVRPILCVQVCDIVFGIFIFIDKRKIMHVERSNSKMHATPSRNITGSLESLLETYFFLLLPLIKTSA